MKLKSLFTLIAAVALAFNATAATPPAKEVGIQLYSVRQLMAPGEKYASNVAGLLKSLGNMGYTQVEAAGYGDGRFYGLLPEEYAEAAKAAGVKPLSSHTGRTLNDEELRSGDMTQLIAWWDEAIAAHKAAGISYIVLPAMGVPSTLADLQKHCDALNAIGYRCKANGLRFGYHNHAHEFTKIEGTPMLDYMLAHTDPDAVFFQMDVYWAIIGDASPVDYFNKYPGRFRLLHIKDRREIGQSGMVGFDAIFRNATTAGLENYFVEIEEYTNGIEDGARESINYLLNAPYVKPSYTKQ